MVTMEISVGGNVGPAAVMQDTMCASPVTNACGTLTLRQVPALMGAVQLVKLHDHLKLCLTLHRSRYEASIFLEK